MSLTAKNTGDSIPPMEEGTYQAVCTGLIDIGLQKSEKFDKISQKVMIMWSFPSEIIKINDEEKPRIISREYTSSLGDKSNLRKDLQAWRGKVFTEEELKGFDLLNILNVHCLIQIIHKEKNGNKYPEIASIMALPKDMKKADTSCIEQHLVFDFDNKETWVNYFQIPEWIQNKIKNATNYESSGLKEYIDANVEMENSEKEKKDDGNDLPF